MAPSLVPFPLPHSVWVGRLGMGDGAAGRLIMDNSMHGRGSLSVRLRSTDMDKWLGVKQNSHSGNGDLLNKGKCQIYGPIYGQPRLFACVPAFVYFLNLVDLISKSLKITHQEAEWRSGSVLGP